MLPRVTDDAVIDLLFWSVLPFELNSQKGYQRVYMSFNVARLGQIIDSHLMI